MKQKLYLVALFSLMLLSACGGNSSNQENANNADPNAENVASPEENETTSSENSEENQAADGDTITYQSENGPIEVPANPERVIVLSSFAGNVMALDVNLIGADAWSMGNPRFTEMNPEMEEVSDEALEKIIELEPDLILGLSTINNIDKLQEIAPTVTFTYGAVDYLTQHVEIGKVLNKEEEAQNWVDDFESRAIAAGDEIRAEIGEDTTVSVIEAFDKQLYVYGDNWGRGTEILYQAMEMPMPDKVAEVALADGYYALSVEVFPEYAGDYIIISKFPGSDLSYEQTETYQTIPAVTNGQVFEVNGAEFYFNDPLTLDYQLDFFLESFLGE